MNPLGLSKAKLGAPYVNGTLVLVFIEGYLLIPGDTWFNVLVKVAIGWAAAAGVIIGTRRHRPACMTAWYLFAAGVFANTTGTLVEAVEVRLLHNPAPVTLADASWLALYPAVIVGLALLIRRRRIGRDWATLVDAATICTGLGLLSWVYLINPAVGDATVGQLTRVVVVAYPVGDLVVLSMFVPLLIGSGTRSRSFNLMTGSVLAFLVADLGWAISCQMGWNLPTMAAHLLDLCSLAAYSMLAAAALHPSVREIDEHVQAPRLSGWVLGLLTFSSLIAPAILLMETAEGRVTDGVAIGISSAALFLLVVTRMVQRLRQVEAQAHTLRALTLVDELTGLPNRRALASDLAVSIETARRDQTPLSVAMVDLDHFKAFNDTFGHPAGDLLLKAAGQAWLQQIRPVDRLVRYGGEEFILVMNGSGSDQSGEVLARMQAVTPHGQTFSAGIATWELDETRDELVARADRALYAAKGAGRDCFMTAEDSGQILGSGALS